MLNYLLGLLLSITVLYSQGKNYQSVAGMIANINEIEVISNNVANSETAGFKEDNLIISTFTKEPNPNFKKGFNFERNTKDAGNFIRQTVYKLPKTTDSYKNNKNGNLKVTGNPFNFALALENKWFILEKLGSKEKVFTRDGRFIVMNGAIRNNNGFPVMSSTLNKIEFTGKLLVEEIGIADIKIQDLKNIGGNLYSLKNKKQEYEKETGNKDYVLQGALENSNVNSVLQMTKLIKAHRLVDQFKKSLQTTQDLDKSSNDLMGLK